MKFLINEDLTDHTSSNKIRWYWDKFTRSWIIQALDTNNNELESSYAGDISGRDYEIEIFKNKYQTLDSRKYRSDE